MASISLQCGGQWVSAGDLSLTSSGEKLECHCFINRDMKF